VCAAMIHFLFTSRTTEADSETQGSGSQKWESESILTSLSPSSLPLMSQWPGTQNNLLLWERSCSGYQHWCRSLDEIVYEDRANNAAMLSAQIQIVMLCMFALRQSSEQARIEYTFVWKTVASEPSA
jgi:hypothetical protein